MITSHWGCWVLWLLPKKKIKRKVEISQKDKRKEQRKPRLNLYNVLFTPFRVSPRCGRGWVVWILPTGGEGGFLWLLPTEVLVFGYFLKEERRKRNYIYTYILKTINII